MNKEIVRRWPWNNDDEDNYLEPYDEFEDVRRKEDDEWEDM